MERGTAVSQEQGPDLGDSFGLLVHLQNEGVDPSGWSLGFLLVLTGSRIDYRTYNQFYLVSGSFVTSFPGPFLNPCGLH